MKNNLGIGLRLGMDLTAAIVVGIILGYWLDIFFKTSPLFMIIFIILGFAAGIRNIFRSTTTIIHDSSGKNDNA